MAKSARRRKTEPASALPPALERFLQRLSEEPRFAPHALIVAVLAVALYAAGLGYPLVAGDFALLAPASLKISAVAAPTIGGEWLAPATFGWMAKLAGSQIAWHRVLNLAVHIGACVAALAFFRHLAAGTGRAHAAGLAPGWIAFFAACLFALSPAAVYAVAYLAERTHLLAGVFTLAALWSTARAARDGWRGAWLVGPLACAAALACTPSAIALPLAMALLVIALSARGSRPAAGWGSTALAAAIAAGYAAALAVQSTEATAGASADYGTAFGSAAYRFAQYLGFWLVPATPWMAAEMTEPAIGAWSSWRGLSASSAIVVLAAGSIVLMRRRASPAACAATALLCTLSLYLPELMWPRLAEPFALARGYAWMACACVVLPLLIGYLPARLAFAVACVFVLLWAALAANRLQTFSSHVALWNDAVRRVELVGASPQDVRIYINRATVHRRDGHLFAAIADYNTALALEPDNRRALRGRAQALVDDQQYDAALRDLDRLLQLEPTQLGTLADRAMVLMQAGRLDEAGRAFDRAIERGVNEPKVFLNRALTRLRSAGIEAAGFALADIERAIEIDPKYALAHFNRGLLFEEAAKAGLKVRDAASPEIMRAIAEQNMMRACQLGHAPACARLAGKKPADEAAPNTGPIRVTPETLRKQGLPLPK